MGANSLRPLREDCRPLREFYPEYARRSGLHYNFAHVFFPEYLFENPAALHMNLTGNLHGVQPKPADPTRFIQSRWQMMEQVAGLIRTPQSLEEMQQTPFRRVTDLEAWTEPVAGKFALFVQMPRPETPPPGMSGGAHAFYIGVVWINESEPRYFTLERTIGQGEERFLKEGLLCEWTMNRAGRSHHNYGQLFLPERATFVAAVAAMVEQGESPELGSGTPVAGEKPGGAKQAAQTPDLPAEPALPLRMGCVTEGWYWDYWIRVGTYFVTHVPHDYRLEVPAEGRRTAQVTCLNCGKNVRVEVRSAPAVDRYRWQMVGVSLAVPVMVGLLGKLLYLWHWANEARPVQILCVLGALAVFVEIGVFERIFASLEALRFEVRTRGHLRLPVDDS